MNNVLSVLVGIILIWLAWQFLGWTIGVIVGVILLVIGVRFFMGGLK